MATFRQKGGGWELRWYEAGRRRSKMVYGTLRDVKAEAAIVERDAPKRPHGGPRTLEDAINGWLAHGGRRSSPTSNAAVAIRARRWIIPHIGHLPLERVTEAALEAFYRRLEEHLAYDSIRNIHWDISGALRLAVREGHLAENRAAKVQHLRKEDRPEIVPPSPAEVAKMLHHLDTANTLTAAELALAVCLAVSTGARRGEVCGLRWGDIDPEGFSVRIERNVVSAHGFTDGAVVRRTKTGTRRTVAVPAALIERLDAHRARWHHLDHESAPDEPILRGRGPGRPLTPAQLSARFRRALVATGLSFRFHDLRHFAASAWLEEGGMSMQAVSRAVGHKRIATTVDTYGHRLNPEVDRRTAEAIERLLRF
jgi:integrase